MAAAAATPMRRRQPGRGGSTGGDPAAWAGRRRWERPPHRGSRGGRPAAAAVGVTIRRHGPDAAVESDRRTAGAAAGGQPQGQQVWGSGGVGGTSGVAATAARRQRRGQAGGGGSRGGDPAAGWLSRHAPAGYHPLLDRVFSGVDALQGEALTGYSRGVLGVARADPGYGLSLLGVIHELLGACQSLMESQNGFGPGLGHP